MLSPTPMRESGPQRLHTCCGHKIPVRILNNGVRDQLVLADPNAPFAAAFWDYCPYCLQRLQTRRPNAILAPLLAVPSVVPGMPPLVHPSSPAARPSRSSRSPGVW